MAESIGAENKGGVRIGISHKIIRVDLIRCSYTLEQYISLWMGLCLFPGQMSQIHLVLHIGLILRQLIDGIGNHVSSRVADVHDVIFVIHNQKSYDCCTCVFLFRMHTLPVSCSAALPGRPTVHEVHPLEIPVFPAVREVY